MKSSENKIGRMEDPTFAIPVREAYFEIAIITAGLQILENKQNGGQKAEPFESKNGIK